MITYVNAAFGASKNTMATLAYQITGDDRTVLDVVSARTTGKAVNLGAGLYEVPIDHADDYQGAVTLDTNEDAGRRYDVSQIADYQQRGVTVTLPETVATLAKQDEILGAFDDINVDISEEQIDAIAAVVGGGIADAVVSGVERDDGVLQSFVEPMGRIRDVQPPEAAVVLWPAPIQTDKIQVMVDLAEFAVGQVPSLTGLPVTMLLKVVRAAGVPAVDGGEFVVPVSVTETADSDGRAFFELAPTPAGCEWKATVKLSGSDYVLRTFTLSDNDAQVNLAELP